MRNNILKRMTSLMLATALAVTSVVPAFAEEAPAGAAAASETEMQQPQELETQVTQTEPQEMETSEGSSQDDAQESSPQAEESTEPVERIIFLPENGAATYSYEEGRKSEEYSGEDYTVLLYTAGENVLFDVSSEEVYELADSSTGEVFAEPDETGHYDFLMPEADLELRFPAREEPEKETKSPETEKASQPAETDAKTEVQTETEEQAPDSYEWKASNMTIEARKADGSPADESMVLNMLMPEAIMGSAEDAELYGHAVSLKAAEALAKESGEENSEAFLTALEALYPFQAVLEDADGAQTDVQGDMEYTVVFDEEDFAKALADGTSRAKILTYDCEVKDGMPEISDASFVKAEDMDIYLDEDNRITMQFITDKASFAIVRSASQIVIPDDEPETDPETEQDTEIETETETEAETDTEETETDTEAGTQAETEVVPMQFANLRFTDEDGFFCVDENGTLGSHMFLSLTADNVNGVPAAGTDTTFTITMPDTIAVPPLSAVDGKVVDERGVSYIELFDTDGTDDARITEASSDGQVITINVETAYEAGSLDPFAGFELDIIGSQFFRVPTEEEAAEKMEELNAEAEDPDAETEDAEAEDGEAEDVQEEIGRILVSATSVIYGMPTAGDGDLIQLSEADTLVETGEVQELQTESEVLSDETDQESEENGNFFIEIPVPQDAEETESVPQDETGMVEAESMETMQQAQVFSPAEAESIVLETSMEIPVLADETEYEIMPLSVSGAGTITNGIPEEYGFGFIDIRNTHHFISTFEEVMPIFEPGIQAEYVTFPVDNDFEWRESHRSDADTAGKHFYKGTNKAYSDRCWVQYSNSAYISGKWYDVRIYFRLVEGVSYYISQDGTAWGNGELADGVRLDERTPTVIEYKFEIWDPDKGTKWNGTFYGSAVINDIDNQEVYGDTEGIKVTNGLVKGYTTKNTVLADGKGNRNGYVVGTVSSRDYSGGNSDLKYWFTFRHTNSNPLTIRYDCSRRFYSFLDNEVVTINYHIEGTPPATYTDMFSFSNNILKDDDEALTLVAKFTNIARTSELLKHKDYSGYSFTGWKIDSMKGSTWTGGVMTKDIDVYGRYEKIPENGNFKVVKKIVDPTGSDIQLDGFVFNLSGISDEGNPVKVNATTDSKGEARFTGIEAGTYTLTEVETPGGNGGIAPWWRCNPQSQSVTVTADQETVAIMTNEPVTGNVKVIKTVVDHSGLASSRAGFEFVLDGISDAGMTIHQTGYTDADGVINFNNVPIGEFTITETGTPDGNHTIPEWWDCRPITQSVIIRPNSTTQVNIENTYKTGNLRVFKDVETTPDIAYDKDAETRYSESKAGFAFRLFGTSTSGKEIDRYAVTNEEGIAEFNHIPIGDNYTVAEVSKEHVEDAAKTNTYAESVKSSVTQDLKRYTTPESHQVRITYDDSLHAENTTDTSFFNVLRKWRITVSKKDREMLQDGKAQQYATLEGAVYGLYDDDVLVERYTTDAEGTFTTKYYTLGDKWYFKELKASEGYLIDPNKYHINASVDDIPGGEEFNEASLAEETQDGADQNRMYENVMRASVKYYKIDGDTKETDKEWLKGAGFSVYSLLDLEKIYGVNLSTMTDSQVVQWAFDNLRDNATQSYEKNIRGKTTATVYADPKDEDVVNGGLVKSFSYKGGPTVNAGSNRNEYIVTELFTNDDGIIQTPRLPYGRYLWVETTTPAEHVAAAPRVLTVDSDDRDAEVFGDGAGTPNRDVVIWDADVTAYIEIKKRDSATGRIVSTPNAKYVIHDISKAYFNWYMEDATEAERKTYKEKFDDLVVDYSDGYRGSYSNPYVTVVQRDMDGNRSATYIRTTQPLPEGEYLIEEVGAPDKYILHGNEGKYREDEDGNRFYEVENASESKWNDYHQEMDPSMTGKYDIDYKKAGQSAGPRVTINQSTVLYDSLVRGFVIEAIQTNDPGVGKVAVYAEGEYITEGNPDGSTITERLGDSISSFPGYPTGDIGESSSLEDYRNYSYKYEYAPIENSVFVIKAAADIVASDGSKTVEFAKGATVTTLTTDAEGHAWTEEIETNTGTTYYGLPIGKYTIEQVKAGKGFALSKENAAPRNFEITYDGERVPIVYRDEAYNNPRQIMTMEIGKYDLETKDRVAGAIFGLYTREDITGRYGDVVIPHDTLVAISETVEQADGSVSLAGFDAGYWSDGVFHENGGLPLGKYYLKELRAPKGYVSSPTKQLNVDAVYNENQQEHIVFSGDTFTSPYIFKNEQTKVRLNVMDFDTNVELDGAELTIEDTEGNILHRVVSVHGDTPLIRKLEVNKKYTVKEIKPRKGYSNVVYEKDGYISPYRATGYTVNGMHFDYVDVKLSNVTANHGDFVVQDKSGVQTINIFNKPVKADIKLQKKGEVPEATIEDNTLKSVTYTVKGLPNAQYKVYAAKAIKHPDGYTADIYEEGAQISVLMTDSGGYATLKALPLGTYRIVETKAPAGYTRAGDQTIDLMDYYEMNFYNIGMYGPESFEFNVLFENERQIVDLGTDPEPNPKDPTKPEEQDDPADPNRDLYLKTGVYKTGVDGDEEKPVEGAEFTLYAYRDIVDVFGNVVIPRGTIIEKALSGKDGRAVFLTDLPIGEYIVHETAHPYGYYSTNAYIVFDTAKWMNDDQVKYIRMAGEVKNAITRTRLFLKDDLTKNELAGATLLIIDEDGNVFETVVTENTEGEGHLLKGLDPGKEYTIAEVIPRRGYTNTVIIPEEMKDLLKDKSRNEVLLTIEDVEVNADLSNVPDDITVEIDNAFVTGSIGLSKEGEVLTGLDRTEKNLTIFDRLVTWVKSAVIYTLKKQPDVEFTVYAAEDIWHPDGVTGLLYKAGDVVGMHVRRNLVDARALTGMDGNILFGQMYLGKYIVKETSTPVPYAKNTIETAVTLAYKDYETQEVGAVEGLVEYKNILQKILATVTKHDLDHPEQVIEGAVFGLYAAEDIKGDSGDTVIAKDLLLETAVTGEDGKATFEAELPIGKYYITEVLPPLGYTSSEEMLVIDAVYETDGREYQTFDFDFSNEITKVDILKIATDTDEALAGATLAVIAPDGTTADEWVTDEEAAHRIEGLVVGRTYVLREKMPAPGYATSDDVEFTVLDRVPGEPYEPQEVEMEDDPIRIQIDVVEENYAHERKPLDGVELHVTDPNGNLVVVEDEQLKWVSKDGETGYYERVPVGEYTVTVDSVPAGYVRPDDTIIHVEDTSDLQNFVIPVGTIIIDVKVLDKETKEPVDDVLVDVLDEDGNVVYDDVTPEWVQEYVPAGDYTLRVESAPDEYIIPDDVDITVSETTDMQEFVIELGVTHIGVKPVDKETGKNMKGVKMHLEDEDGNTVAEWKSDGKWEFFDRVIPGDYTVVVDKVPDGYIIPDDKEITVEAIEDLQYFEVEIPQIRIAVKPVDKDTGKDMSGVKMHLEDDNGDVVGKWTSDGGWKLFKKLKPGTYTIVTDAVPSGYTIPEKMPIEVESIEDLQKFIVEIGKPAPAPAPAPGAPSGGNGSPAPVKTGDNAPIGMLLALLVASIAVFLLLFARKARKKTNR